MTDLSFDVCRRHLRDEHGRVPAWYPDTETFDAYLARLEEFHIDVHLEPGVVADHSHGFLMTNRCPICDGQGDVTAFSNDGSKMLRITCPECAGLAIAPASADDGLASA